MLLGLLVAVPATATRMEDSLGKGKAGQFDLQSQFGFNKGDEIEVEVRVTSGSQIDVYIMNKANWDKYAKGDPFTVEVTKERIKDTSFTWTVPDEATWYLVIDNLDNLHNSDATPTGAVSFEGQASIPSSSMDYVIGGVIFIVLVVILGLVRAGLRSGFSSLFGGGRTSRAHTANRSIHNPANALGFRPGSKGEALPTGSDIVERPWFGEGGYFSQNPGPQDGEDEAYYEEEEQAVAAEAVADDGEAVMVSAGRVSGPEPGPSPPGSGEGTGLPGPKAESITIACPGCAHKFPVARTGAAQKVTCPACGLTGTMQI